MIVRKNWETWTEKQLQRHCLDPKKKEKSQNYKYKPSS